MARKPQAAQLPAVPAKPSETQLAASHRASDRLVRKVEAGEERLMLGIRTTGHNQSTREAINGMTETELTIRLMDALGTTSPEFVDGMLVNLLTYFNAPDDRRATREMNTALAVLDGLKPDNEVEAMLATQMVATNDAAMKCLASIAGNALNAETFGNLAVKLLRTFTAQAEALAKLRRKGEQVVKVVHVHPGGQAVVGDVHNHPQARGGGSTSKIEEQPHGTAPCPGESPALPSPDPARDGVPIASDAERPMPHPRRAVTRRPARKSERP